MKSTRFDRFVLAVNSFIIAVFSLSIIYPIYYIFVLSFNDGRDAEYGGIYLWPRVFTLSNYMEFLKDRNILTSLTNSVVRTIAGVVLTLVVTSMFAYAVSKRRLMFRNAYLILAFFTMYFSGGMIPMFIILRSMGFINNFLVYFVPSCFSVGNAILFISFFKTLPESMEESAFLDGANSFQVFVRLTAPVSKPVFAAIALFVGVTHWNDWKDTMLFTTSESLYTLSYLLVRRMNVTVANVEEAKRMTSATLIASRGMTSQSLLLATSVITMIPILMVYPFLQKYFIKGIMIGSIKG